MFSIRLVCVFIYVFIFMLFINIIFIFIIVYYYFCFTGPSLSVLNLSLHWPNTLGFLYRPNSHIRPNALLPNSLTLAPSLTCARPAIRPYPHAHPAPGLLLDPLHQLPHPSVQACIHPAHASPHPNRFTPCPGSSSLTSTRPSVNTPPPTSTHASGTTITPCHPEQPLPAPYSPSYPTTHCP